MNNWKKTLFEVVLALMIFYLLCSWAGCNAIQGGLKDIEIGAGAGADFMQRFTEEGSN